MRFNCLTKNCPKFGRLKTKPSFCYRCNSVNWRRKNIIKSREWSKNNYYLNHDKLLKENKKRNSKKLIWYHNTKINRKDKLKMAANRNHRTISGRYASLKRDAKVRNFSLEFSKEEHQKLLSSNKCYYCEGSLNKSGSGLDRKDSNKNYTLDNVVTCCKNCNSIKLNLLTSDEMLKVAKLLKQIRNKDTIW